MEEDAIWPTMPVLHHHLIKLMSGSRLGFIGRSGADEKSVADTGTRGLYLCKLNQYFITHLFITTCNSPLHTKHSVCLLTTVGGGDYNC